MEIHVKFKNIIFALLLTFCISLCIPTGMSEVKAAAGLGPTDAFYNIDNFHYTFQTIDGGTVTSQAQNKPKLLIFIDINNVESQRTIRDMCLVSKYEGVDIIVIETTGATKAQVAAFEKQYANGKDYLDFCYSTAGYNDYMWNYLLAVEPGLNNSVSPVLVYIDANDKIQYLSISLPTTDEIVDNLNKYCNAGLELQITPEIYKITNVVSGIHLYWNAAEGAEKYSVYRTDPTSVFAVEWVADTTATHYTDTDVKSGVTYEYFIASVFTDTDGTEVSINSSRVVKKATYVATPDINLRVNRAGGVGLGWNKIDGATGYAIYRKPYSGNAAWSRVVTITDPNQTTWNDTSVKTANGTAYRYTIRALAGSDMKTLSGCRNTGRTMTRLTSRTINSATKTGATSIKCIWTTTSQANGYEVRFMNGSTVVKQFTVNNYKTGAKTFTGIPAGANYKVQVRSYKTVSGVGTFYSAWSTAKYVKL